MEGLSARTAVEALSASEGVCAAVLGALEVGLVVEDRAGAILACNPSALRILGLTREQLTGEAELDPGWCTIHEDGWPLPAEERPAHIALATGAPCTGMSLGVKQPGGAVTWVAANAYPLREDDRDEPYAVAVSYTDVSAARARAGEQRRANERYRSLIEYSSDIITILDEQGQQVYESPGVERVLGFAPGDFEGTSRLSQIHPEDASGVLAAFAAVTARPGATASLEYRVRARDGSWRIVESVATNRLHDPAVLGVVLNTRDLTERRREQQALRATTSRLTNLVQNLQAGVLVEDEERRVAVANAEFCAIFGIDAPPSVLVGADCVAAVERSKTRTAAPERFCTRIDELITARTPVIGEEVEFADGRTFERDYIPISDDRADRGHLWLYRDISARKAAETEISETRDEAIRAARTKAEFLATMSHEIRTPMNGVIGTIELLLGTPLSGDQRELATVVRDSASGLLDIIDDVLDLSKSDAQKLEPNDVEFDPAAVVEGVADMLLPQARRKGLRLTSWVDPRATGTLRGDAQWLRQVLVNLLGNAVKFTDAGEVQVRADVESEEPGAMTLRLAVRDSGPGIPESGRERLFEPFAQLSTGAGSDQRGTGLGLAICKRLVELMGGEISVDGRPGAGTTFAFALTFGRTGDPPAAPRPARELRVLLAEACDAATRVVAGYLEAWGVAVDRAETPAEAERLVASARYDVAVVGTSLGGSPGELAARLRECAGGGDLAFILLKELARDGAVGLPAPRPFAAALVTPVKRARLFDAVSAAAALRPTGPRKARALAGARVLVADDNEVNRALILRQLAQLGARAQAVASGAEAIDAAAAGTFDAVLMDWRMPHVDGLAATRAIRAAEGTGPRTPVVALTASAAPEDVEACLAAGMDACVTKPLTTERLRDALEALLAAPEAEALEQLADDLGDRAEAHRIAALFSGGLESLRRDLAAALAAGDAAGLRDLAHRLRSSSAAFGAEQLARLCEDLEVLAGGGGTGSGAEALVAAIDEESRRVGERLEAELRRGETR